MGGWFRGGRRHAGAKGEELAAQYLRDKGYSIIDRNYRSRWGEIDLICRSPDGAVVFVEVKSRHATGFGAPEEAVDPRKQERILRTALAFLQGRGWLDRPARLDVVAVSWHNGPRADIRHIEDAFQMDWR